MDLFGLRERRALIVGGGFGMGRRSAMLLANVGAHVAIVDRDPDRAESVAHEVMATGRRGVAVAADVTIEAAARRAVEDTLASLGGLDVLVNVVGLSQSASLLELGDDQLDTMVNSTAGARAAVNRAAYSASKAALASLTGLWRSNGAAAAFASMASHPE